MKKAIAGAVCVKDAEKCRGTLMEIKAFYSALDTRTRKGLEVMIQELEQVIESISNRWNH